MAYSPAFHESVRLVLHVHRLMNEGKGESPEANSLRAQSEKPWYEMTEEEQELVEGLSEDFYSVGALRAASSDFSMACMEAVLDAAREYNYPKTLIVLRTSESQLPPDFVAHWRGVCWGDMGFLEVAKIFFRDAVMRDPDYGFHQYMLLRAVLHSRRVDESADRTIAETAISQRNDPLLMYVAAGVLFFCAREEKDVRQSMLYRQVATAVEEANTMIQGTLISSARDDATAANIWRSICYAQLGDSAGATKACKDALRLNPYHPGALKLQEKLTESKQIGSANTETGYIESIMAQGSVSSFATASL